MDYDDLIYQIYSTIEDPGSWSEVLANISRQLDSTHAFIAAREDVNQQPFAFIEQGFVDGHFELYQQHYYKVDVWTKSLAVQPPNRFHASHKVFNDKQFVQSELYNDFARPVDIRHSIGSLNIADSGDMLTEVAFMRGKRQQQYDEQTVQQANRFLRHIQQSLAIAHKIQLLGDNSLSLDVFLNKSLDPMLVVNADNQVLNLNQAAEFLLRSSGIFRVSLNKTLSFFNLRAQGQFEALKQSVSSGAAGASNYLLIQTAGGHYKLLVQPWLQSSMSALGGQKVAAFLLTVSFVKSEAEVPVRDLCDLYGFTLAESEVAHLLCKGNKSSDIAEMRQTSVATVRQQVKSCMAKAGCKSQAELVSKILINLLA